MHLGYVLSKVSTFHTVVIFFMFIVASYTSRKAGSLFPLLVCSVICVQIIGYFMARRSHSSVCALHYLIVIIIVLVQWLNFCQAYSVECVSKIKSNLSIIFNVIYEWDCVFHLTHFSFHDCENICTSSYYLHEIGHRNHCHAMLMFTYSTTHQNTTGSTGSRPRPSETVVSLQCKCDIIINFIDQTATA